MAIEYMAQYFTPSAPELYLRSISAVIRLPPVEGRERCIRKHQEATA
jgi:hypothetical protein